MKTTDSIQKAKTDGIDISCETEELLEYPRNLSEWAHEYADSSEDVIYYGKAHDLIRQATCDEQGEAEDMLHETDGLYDKPGYDQIATRIAYWIVYNRAIRQVQEELEAIKEWIDEQEEEGEEEHEEIREAIEEIEN